MFYKFESQENDFIWLQNGWWKQPAEKTANITNKLYQNKLLRL